MDVPLLWGEPNAAPHLKGGELEASRYSATYDGLTDVEADELLRQQGAPEAEMRMWQRVARSFIRPMPLFLVAVAVVCFVIHDWITGLVVVSLTALHVGLTTHEELQMEGSAKVLRDFLTTTALVKRSGEWRTVSSRNVVVGDLMRIKMGDVVPADASLLAGEAMDVDQSVVTGESVPVTKDVGDIIFSGSVVQTGNMVSVVLRTGQKSMVGRSAQLVSGPKARTRLQTMLLSIAGIVTIVALILAVVLMAVKLGMGHSSPIFVVQTALGMLVAAVPISMGVIVTSAFVLTSRELGDLGIMVSRFAAIEQLAGMEVSLLDKTGTITQNKLQLAEPWLAPGVTHAELLEDASLASCVETPDAIDKAILAAVNMELTLRSYSIIKHESFTSVKKHSSAIIRQQSDGAHFEVKKGAAQAVVDYCGLSGVVCDQMMAAVSELAQRGMRSLAVASKRDGKEWRLLGLVTMRDSLRGDAKEFLAGLVQLGVEPKMITGDGIEIARETCKLVGLGNNVISRARLLDHVGRGDFDLSKVDAFSQVFPEDKFNVVALLQRDDKIVGMTGDGINDCPAMRQADVGIAVHGAAPACMAAADLILSHPQLNVIKDAILLCRMSVERLRNYLFFRINSTTVILFWSFFGALEMRFGFPALAFVCIAWTNNLAIFSIICDNALVSMTPAKWKSIDVVPLAILFCLSSCLELFLVFYLAAGGYFLFSEGLSVGQLRGVALLSIILLQQWAVLVVRSRSMFLAPESCKPGWLLLLVMCANSFAGTLLVAFWPFGEGLEPVAWNDIAQVWIITGVALLFKDLVKLLFSWVIDQEKGKMVPSDSPDYLDSTVSSSQRLKDRAEPGRGSLVTMMDRIFDVLFIVSVSHLGVPLFAGKSQWAWADFISHWIPIFYTWLLLEGFVNRYHRVFWVPFLYLCMALTFGGIGINFLECRMVGTISTPIVLSSCFSFGIFLFLGRCVLATTWFVAALTNARGRSFLAWKTVCVFVPGVLYWSGAFVSRWQPLLLPILWFVALSLDILLNFVPSSFVWLDREWPRHPRYTEERHGLLQLIALAEVVISVVMPRSAVSSWYTDRYTDVTLVLVLIFVLALWNFVVCETGKSVESHGGMHALHGDWWRRSIWMACQFLNLTGIIIAGLVAKTFSLNMSNFDRVTFGVSIALAILSGALSQAMLVSSPKEHRRLISKPVRLLIRMFAGTFAVAVAPIPVSAMTDSNWLIVFVVIISASCVAEWIGRFPTAREKHF